MHGGEQHNQETGLHQAGGGVRHQNLSGKTSATTR